MSFFAMGAGFGTKSHNSEWLEVFFPLPILNPNMDLIDKIADLTGYQGGNQSLELDGPTCHALEELFIKNMLSSKQSMIFSILECSKQPKVLTLLETNSISNNIPEIYLKLHLLSHRLVMPNKVNLAGMFGILPNVAWTNIGPIGLSELADHQFLARARGEHLHIKSIDKLPMMSDYVIPKGVRIADTARIRLGAYVGEGTTVMHEGFINFNAGTEGRSMIEGRVSAGVFVGQDSDLGGGCSTMGTLSGGNKTLVSVGERCLIGANAGIGIALGHDCTVEAGLYVTSGSKVTVLDHQLKPVKQLKAQELSGQDKLCFRRNSCDGKIECFPNKKPVELNEELHDN